MEKNNITRENGFNPDTRSQDWQSKRDWRHILPGLVVSAISLAIIFYFSDLDKLIQALRLANYWFIFIALLLMLVWLVVRGFLWRTLLRDQASHWDVFFTINEGYLLNNLLPFRLGEIGRAFLLSRKANMGFWEVISSIVVERVMDLSLAVALLLFTIPFVVGVSWQGQAALVTGIVVLVVFLALYLLARHNEWAAQIFERWSSRWPLIARVGGNIIPPFLLGLTVLTDGRRFLKAVGWELVNWVIVIIQYYVFLLAFFPEGKLLWSTFSLAVAALGIAAPSSPGAIGVFEAAIVGALSAFNLNVSVALAFGISAHLLQYLVTGVLGAYALARDGMTLTGLYRRVRVIE